MYLSKSINSPYFRIIKYYLSAILLLLLISFVSQSAPLIADPTFSRLSTENGLSQNTINSLLLDSEGFLWLGTAEGLNRFDGYQNQHVLGPNNEFNEATINHLFQDSKRNLWISDSINGVHQYNLISNTTKHIINLRLRRDSQLTQEARYISENEKGEILFSMDEGVYSYSYVTDKLSAEYSLPDKMIDSGDFVRTHLLLQGILFIGTTDGLYGVVRGNSTPFLISHVQSDATTIDNLNVKMLYADNQDTLWIGTVEGLFSLPLSHTIEFILGTRPTPEAKLLIEKRNIWGLAGFNNDLFYLATDKGLYSYQTKSKQLQHILLPTDSRDFIASDVLKNLVIDSNNNLWLGSESDGAIYWSPRTSLFNNVYNTKGGRVNKILSHNYIWSIYQQDKDSLWVGTRNGLNLFNLSDGTTQSFLVSSDEKAQYSSSTIINIEAGKDNQLWLNTGGGVLRFDGKTGKTYPLKINSIDDDVILKSDIWDILVTPKEQILLVTDAGFYRYSPNIGKVDKIEQLSASIDSQNSTGFIKGVKSNTTLISVYGQLWEMNNTTSQVTLIHETPLQQLKLKIFPRDVLIDTNNIMWITYPGYGLVGIDALTYEEKFFYNKQNLLPNNAIFDMQLDTKGNIWISSNSGLIKFSPQNHHIQKFNHEDGLANSEFNGDSSLTLLDGRMVYGSPKGLIFFDPLKLSLKKNHDVKVSITNVKLVSNDLVMPFSNLDGQSIELTHDDVGLSIHFSTLEYQNQKSTKYQYQLSGKNNLTYPITTRPEVMFPKLWPGHYVFSVLAFNTENGAKSKPAIINIKVNYAPWASPLAYTFYSLIALIGLLLLWQFRRAHNLRLYKAHQEALLSKNKLTLALHASNSGIWEYQTEQDSFFVSRLEDEFTNKKTTSFQNHISFIHSKDRARYKSAWQDFITNNDTELDITYRMSTKNRTWLWFRDVGKVVETNKQGEPLLVTGTYTNITETVANQENLRLFGEAFKHTLDWVIIYNHKYYPIAFNDAFKKYFGIKDDAQGSKELAKLLKLQTSETTKFWKKMLTFEVGRHWQEEDKVLLPNGNIIDIMVNIHVVASVHDKNKIENFLVIISDITEQKATEAKLLTLANYDSLTGLPNRALLLDRIERGLEHARRNEKNMAVFFIDLDKFKQVNDSLGHNAGDELLVIIAKRLEDKLRKEDTVARLGGDEFVIMIEDVTSAETISTLVNEISDIIDIPVTLSSQTVSVSSSIGIAMYPGDGLSAEDLLKNADIAMYHAKEQGRSNFQFFTQQMDELVKGRLKLENQLKKAHQAKIFENYYQPIFNTQSNKIEGFEILMRWPTPNGMIPPDKFIPVSEELGLIEHMTLDAFERAMPVLNEMRQNGFNGYLSVNLSAKHFRNQSSIEKIILLLEQNNVPVTAIRFEITESALMRDYDKALMYMTHIQQKGFLIALDDFGTGFSSLKYLKEFPINIIKVDKSFVDDIGKNQNNEAIILTTLSMAKQLKMSCVAEGIETIEQVEFFKKNKCQHLQGYYFSKPVPAEKIPALLEKTW
jgi:diguanylate cyclase (GGDEF)-like protein/PAS domain S-box-containing protein